MAVYAVNIATTPTNAAGERTTSVTSELINNHSGSNFVSSEDYADKGVQVIDGKTGSRKSVYTADDLDASDIVRGGWHPDDRGAGQVCGLLLRR
jgi:hypothetical protein